MKKTLLALMMLSAAAAYAGEAEDRLQAAQSDIDRLKGEIQTALAQKEQQNAKLQQAGQMLDAAWNAVYGAGGSKATQ